MAEEQKTPEMPAGGGSYIRDAKTGKLKLAEAPTAQEPSVATPKSEQKED